MQETAIQELNIPETAIAENIFKANQSASRNWREVIQDYTELTKPRIIVLLLITTAGAMWIASEGQVDAFLMFITVLGGAIAAASANAINCLYDRDIDAKMERTSWRPLPSGRIQPLHALIFAIALAIISFTLLTVYANLLAACLAMSGIATYVGVYTIWLKRSSTQNIVIGGAAGAIPALVGWAAVTDTLSWSAWLIFAIVFLWTPPHFWALALMIRDDYAKVGIPMLPVVAGDKATVKQILFYTVITVTATILLFYPLHASGIVYAVIALTLGGVFVHKSWRLLQNPEDKTIARELFLYSISYMMLLCLGMVVDSLPVTHHLLSTVLHQFHL